MAVQFNRFARRGGFGKHKQDVGTSAFLSNMDRDLQRRLAAHKTNSQAIYNQQREWLTSKQDAERQEKRARDENQQLENDKQDLKIRQTRRVARQIIDRGEAESRDILRVGEKLSHLSSTIGHTVVEGLTLLDQIAYGRALDGDGDGPGGGYGGGGQGGGGGGGGSTDSPQDQEDDKDREDEEEKEYGPDDFPDPEVDYDPPTKDSPGTDFPTDPDLPDLNPEGPGHEDFPESYPDLDPEGPGAEFPVDPPGIFNRTPGPQDQWPTKPLLWHGDHDKDGIPNSIDVNFDPTRYDKGHSEKLALASWNAGSNWKPMSKFEEEKIVAQTIEEGIYSLRSKENKVNAVDFPDDGQDPAVSYSGQALRGLADTHPANKIRNTSARMKMGSLTASSELGPLAERIKSASPGMDTQTSLRRARTQLIRQYGAEGNYTAGGIKFRESLVKGQSRLLEEERQIVNRTKQKEALEGITTSILADSSPKNVWRQIDELQQTRNRATGGRYTPQEARRHVIDSLIENNQGQALTDFFDSPARQFDESHPGSKTDKKGRPISSYGDLYPQDRRYATEKMLAKFRKDKADRATQDEVNDITAMQSILPGFSANPGDPNYEGSAAQAYDVAVATNDPEVFNTWIDQQIEANASNEKTKAYLKSIAFKATQQRKYASIEQWAQKLKNGGEYEELANFIRTQPTDSRRKLEAKYMPWLQALEGTGVKSTELHSSFKKTLAKSIDHESWDKPGVNIPTLDTTTAIAWGIFNEKLAETDLKGKKAVLWAQRETLIEIAQGKEDISSPFHVTAAGDSPRQGQTGAALPDQAYFTNQLSGIPEKYELPNIIVNKITQDPLAFQNQQFFPTRDLREQLTALKAGDSIELTADQEQVLHSLNGELTPQDLINGQLRATFPEEMGENSLSVGTKDIVAARRIMPGVYWSRALREAKTIQNALQLDLFATVKENFPPESAPFRSLINRNALESVDAGMDDPLQPIDEDVERFGVKGYERKDKAVFGYGFEAAKVLAIAKHQDATISGEDLLNPGVVGIRFNRPNVYYAVKGSPLYNWSIKQDTEGSGHVRACTYQDLNKPLTTICFEPRK